MTKKSMLLEKFREAAASTLPIVLLVARKTGSLIWCAVVGMGVYALASLL